MASRGRRMAGLYLLGWGECRFGHERQGGCVRPMGEGNTRWMVCLTWGWTRYPDWDRCITGIVLVL